MAPSTASWSHAATHLLTNLFVSSDGHPHKVVVGMVGKRARGFVWGIRNATIGQGKHERVSGTGF